MRKIVDDDVGVDAVALDQPLAFRSVDADFRRRGNSAVGFEITAAQPDLASPSAHTDGLAQLEAMKSFGERLAVGCGFLIA